MNVTLRQQSWGMKHKLALESVQYSLRDVDRLASQENKHVMCV